MHSLPIILHLEPDGSSESPGDVEESFDDESPFFLWGPHRSVTSQTVAAQRLLFFLSVTPQKQETESPWPRTTKYTPTQRRASSAHMLQRMRAGSCRRKQEVFFLLLSPGLATCRAGASTELLSQESPRTLQVSGRHVHTTWRKHGLATRAGRGSVAQTVPGQKFPQLPGPPGHHGPCVPCFVLLATHPDSGSTK